MGCHWTRSRHMQRWGFLTLGSQFYKSSLCKPQHLSDTPNTDSYSQHPTPTTSLSCHYMWLLLSRHCILKSIYRFWRSMLRLPELVGAPRYRSRRDRLLCWSRSISYHLMQDRSNRLWSLLTVSRYGCWNPATHVVIKLVSAGAVVRILSFISY